MQKYFYLSLVGMSFFILASGQAVVKKEAAVQFRSNLQAGFLFGQSGSTPAFTASLINGVEVNKWFAGIGLGVDYYGKKTSLPLFAALQKELGKKANSFFLYGDGGYNFSSLKSSEKLTGVENYKKQGGLFYEAGGGYKFKISATGQLGFSAGYSYKQTKEKYNYPCYWCELSIPPSQVDMYSFRRVVLKINWWFL